MQASSRRARRGPMGVVLVAVGLMALAACNRSASAGAGGSLSTRSISGVGTVLVNGQGLTLYDLPSEKDGHITCTGSCANAWPPLLAVGGKVPSAPSGIAANVGTITRPDGSVQVTFSGMPLYTFAGEAAGQASGQGVGGFVAVTTGGTTATTGGYSPRY